MTRPSVAPPQMADYPSTRLAVSVIVERFVNLAEREMSRGANDDQNDDHASDRRRP
jgi:hypothetical protein